MDCSKKQASAVGDIPEGPLMEILSRVPPKSICRFKCVSKAWLDLITDPHHRKKLPQTMQGLFCYTSKKSQVGMPGSISFIDMAARSMPLSIDPSFSFLTEQPRFRFLYLSDSRNGLVLFVHLQAAHSDRLGYIVCNPTTKEWKDVPAWGSTTWITYPYLAFDPIVSSHFNLVQFELDNDKEFLSVHVYSSETGTWSDNHIDERGEEGLLEGWRQFGFKHADPHLCPFVNGFLHMTVWGQDEVKIVALDVQGKARRMIPAPHTDDRNRWMCYFGESQGQLHYMTQERLNAHEGKYKLWIWVLQDYDAQEWVLKGTVNTDEVFGENSGGPGMEFRVVATHQDYNVAFFTRFQSQQLVAYNMGNKEVSVIATFDDQEWLVSTARYVPYF